MKRALGTTTTGAFLILAFSIGCQTQVPAEEKNTDAEDTVSDVAPTIGEDTGVECEDSNECSDGAFCNGEETCFKGTCHLGEPPNCNDGIDCTTDSCSHAANNCVFAAPDEDGDGHADAACIGPGGEPLGDDCDDNDSSTYPGNTEVCSLDDPSHDEDCNPNTFGHLDADLDGVVSAECCNVSDDGPVCGTDCDDDDYRRYPMHVEICDGIDNDCDDQVDVNTREVPWYPDADGDNFGQIGNDEILSCAPIEGYSLRPSDCDDSSAAIHVAAVEECDGFDNNCDGEIDEDNVCACAPNGNARPCACSNTRTGVQICASGLWRSCNCNECVEGARDCIAGILPRLCVDGQWEFQLACTGQLSECNAGNCTCPGGGTDCLKPGTGAGGSSGVGGAPLGSGGATNTGGASGVGGDFGVGGVIGSGGSGSTPGLAPIVVSYTPFDPGTPVSTSTEVEVTFDQDMEVGSLNPSGLFDAWGNQVPGSLTVEGTVVTFTPDSPLGVGMEYTFSIPASAADVDGEPMGMAFVIDFQTVTDVIPTPLPVGPNTKFNMGRLAISPAGVLSAIFREETLAPPGARAVALDWTGVSWGTVEEISPMWPSDGWEFDIDDAGWIIATAYDGASLARYDRQGGSWSSPAVFTSVSGASTRNLVALNGSGRGFYVFENTTMELAVHRRAANGSYDSPVTDSMFSDFGRAIDINENGVGALGTISGSSLRVLRSSADLTGLFFDTLTTGVWSQDVAVGADGTIYVAHHENGFVNPIDQVFVRVFNGAWGTPIDVAPAGNGDELDPLIGVDLAGDVTVVFRKNNELMAARMSAGAGVFGPISKIGLPQQYNLGIYQMAVAESGDVVVVWIQHSTTGKNLWATRYIASGASWSPAQLLEGRANEITNFDLEMDDSGNAFVLYEVKDISGDESHLVTVP